MAGNGGQVQDNTVNSTQPTTNPMKIVDNSTMDQIDTSKSRNLASSTSKSNLSTRLSRRPVNNENPTEKLAGTLPRSHTNLALEKEKSRIESKIESLSLDIKSPEKCREEGMAFISVDRPGGYVKRL